MHEILIKFERLVKYLIIIISFYYLGILFYLISSRIGYRFELEWLEGDMLLTAVRVLDGLPIYAPPGIDYVPSIYPPVYYYVVALFFKLFEPGFLVMRSVSVLSLIGILSILFSVISRETKTRWLGIIGLGLFASFYNYHSAWYDIARVDSLFYLFLLSGIYLCSFANKYSWAFLVSALLFSFAIYTKQSAVVFAPFAFLYLFIVNKRESIKYLCAVAALCVTWLVILQVSTDGWFADYTLLRPLKFPRNEDYLRAFIHDITDVYPILLLMLLAFFALAVIAYRRKSVISAWNFLKSEITVWEVMLIPAVIVYIRVRPVIGAYQNDSIYLSIWFSILIPIWLKRYVLDESYSSTRRLGLVFLVLILMQLSFVGYRPGKWVPAAESDAKGMQLIERLKESDGPVYVHLHPVYAWIAGKDPYLNTVNLFAFNLAEPGYEPTELYEKVTGQYFSVIVLDNYSERRSEQFDVSRRFTDLVKQHYKPESFISYDNYKEFATLSGGGSRPESIWVPR